jgi:spermidine/putrescine-binding protein
VLRPHLHRLPAGRGERRPAVELDLYASPNEAAREFLDPEVLENPAIFPDEDLMDRLFFLEDTGETEILFTDLFTQAKS